MSLIVAEEYINIHERGVVLTKEWLSALLNKDTVTVRSGVWYEKNFPIAKEGIFEPSTHDELFLIEGKSWWFKQRNAFIEAGINRFPPSENTIVDLGGGNGFVASHLESCGFEVALFEPGAQGIENAKRRGLKNLVCAPVNSTTVKPNSISAIGLFDVLEHISDESSFLNELQEVLKNDGILYITVPAHNFLWSSADEDAGHFRRYNKNSIKNVLADNGFDVVFVSYFFRFLSLPIFLFRTLPSKFLRKKQPQSVTKTSNFIVPKFVERIVSLIYDIEIRKFSRSKIRHGASIFIVATPARHTKYGL